MRFEPKVYELEFFRERGYIRKKCKICGEYFWTPDPDREVCGESPCEAYRFVGRHLAKKIMNVRESRETFLRFCEKRSHTRIQPYPVVARWRDDLFFTHASIVDFQPYVTSGEIPPPANPLVISQPCLRFVDLDNVGPTFGRHLTIFEMGGHHAFNSPEETIYWKNETVSYHHEFVTDELGVKSEEVIYKEGVWSGGGNAGPDVESIIRGLEVATLVFMKFKVINDEFVELPIRTVDTGYGIERYTWLSQGSVSCFHAVYKPILEKVMEMANIQDVDEEILGNITKFSGLLSLEKGAKRIEVRHRVAKEAGIALDELNALLSPLENAFAVVDHTTCLAFMLAEGIVPSNVREGYLARLMLRRTYRLLRALNLEKKLPDIVDLQISYWSQDFPHLKEARDEILEILLVEQEKYKETLKRGSALVKRKAQELRGKGVKELPTETLIEFYDSHGIPPEVVKETLKDEDIKVQVPENFYTMVARRHVQAPPSREAEPLKELEPMLSDLPETRTLYYENPYLTKFEAQVLRVLDNKYVVLDKTAFYPEGGGQPADQGSISFDGGQAEVIDVQKIGNVIVHVVKGSIPKEGTLVKGSINWERRFSLMRHHTAAHIIVGAARRVLGRHVWQSGSQKGVERSRLDISHFRRLTLDEVHAIERLANQIVMENLPVETCWMPRQEAEMKYGFRLYQGGVVPGKDIRVVKVGDWEVEACGGTHVKNTGEIGLIKIVHTERIQDGVERIVFSAGLPALKAVQEGEKLISRVAETLNTPRDKILQAAEKLVNEWKEARREREHLLKEIATLSAREYITSAEDVQGLKVLVKSLKESDVNRLIKMASEIIKIEPKMIVVFCAVNKTARVIVMVGKEAVNRGINAGIIVKKVASMLGGGGSGRAEFAQGGGTLVQKAQEALAKVKEIVEGMAKK